MKIYFLLILLEVLIITIYWYFRKRSVRDRVVLDESKSSEKITDDLRLISVCLLSHLPSSLQDEVDYCAYVLSYPSSHFNPTPISGYLKEKYVGLYTGKVDQLLLNEDIIRAEQGDYEAAITVARTIILNASPLHLDTIN